MHQNKKLISLYLLLLHCNNFDKREMFFEHCNDFTRKRQRKKETSFLTWEQEIFFLSTKKMEVDDYPGIACLVVQLTMNHS